MEPIDDWMHDSMKHMDHAPGKGTIKTTVGAAEVIFKDTAFRVPHAASEVWDGVPIEDAFEFPPMNGDELTSAPPVRYLEGADANAVARGMLKDFVKLADEPDRKDWVNLPSHYARFEIEPIRFICENKLNFFQGNIIKYVLRWDAKDGMQDLEKAQRYLNMFIRWVKKDPDWWR